MGKIIPGNNPEIDPYSWYYVTVAWYLKGFTGCGDTLYEVLSCCISGAYLQNYYTNGGDCSWTSSMCVPSGGLVAPQLIDILGPYTTPDCLG
jgi:hypothetical protein